MGLLLESVLELLAGLLQVRASLLALALGLEVLVVQHGEKERKPGDPGLTEAGRRFLILTNNSVYTPRDLAVRLETSGLHVPADSIWTAAMATARFLPQS